MEDLIYVGTYKVFQVFRKSGRCKVLATGLTREEAKQMVNRFPDRQTSMVCFDKQYPGNKKLWIVNNEN